MAAGQGDDTYVVDNAGDVVTEGANQGTDTVEAWLDWTLGANLEQLRLMGTADLAGTGNALNNALFGNAGNNVLNGGAGADTMTGGLGDDTYIVDNRWRRHDRGGGRRHRHGPASVSLDAGRRTSSA